MIAYERPQGRTLEEWRENVRATDLYKRGDAVLVWVNEADLCPTAALKDRDVVLEEAAKAERERCLAAVDRLAECKVQVGNRQRFTLSELNAAHRNTCTAIREEITGEAVWTDIEDDAALKERV